jgi:hypothetical protein
MEMFANPALVVVFGVVAPFVISLLKHPGWPAWAKQLLTLGVALAFGIVDQALRVEAEGASWSVAQVVERAAVVAVVAQALYWFLLEGSASPAGRLNRALERVGTKPPAPAPLHIVDGHTAGWRPTHGVSGSGEDPPAGPI